MKSFIIYLFIKLQCLLILVNLFVVEHFKLAKSKQNFVYYKLNNKICLDTFKTCMQNFTDVFYSIITFLIL